MTNKYQPPPGVARWFKPMLFVVQFFSWVGMFLLWIFTLPLITALLESGRGNLANVSAEAIRWMGLCFALYVTLAAIINLILPRFYALMGKSRTHGFALAVGAIGLGTMARGATTGQVVASFAAIGIGWASISSTPYHLVSDRVTDERYARAMGIFNFSSVIPQVLVALSMGPMVERLTPAMAIGAGSVSMGVAALLMFGVSLIDHR